MTSKHAPKELRKPLRASNRWLCVFEIDDSGGPRRISDKPRVLVKEKIVQPGAKLDAWLQKTKQSKRPELVRVRYDLMPASEQPTPYQYPRDKQLISAALKSLRKKLLCKGYTVNNSMSVYSLYVIELNDSHIARRPDGYRGYVYVGQTGLSVEERAKQHELGPEYPWKKKPKHSTICHSHFRKLNLGLLPQGFQTKLLCRSAALRAEYDLRLHFESKGYKVEGGKELKPKRPKKRKSDSPAG